jgi:N-methylhydantoinase A
VLEQFEQEGIDAAEVELCREVAVRYRRQAHTLVAQVDAGRLGADTEGLIQERFERRYVSVYGEGALLAGAPVELEAQSVTGTKRVDPPPLEAQPPVVGDGSAAIRGERLAHFGETFVSTPVLDGNAVRAGERILGPAIVERMGDSLVIPAEYEAEVDEYLGLSLRATDRSKPKLATAGVSR